jgi:hypothetical protein
MTLPRLISLNATAAGATLNSFTTIQPITGTAPVATGPNDVLTLDSSDGSITIDGDSSTDTLDFEVSASAKGLYETGAFNTNSLVIPPSTGNTYAIGLGRSDYISGTVMMYIPAAATGLTLSQRKTALMLIGTTEEEAVSQATQYFEQASPSSGGYYSFTIWRHAGFMFSNDSALSEANFGADSTGSSQTVRIKCARIDGSTLLIAFENVNVGITQTIRYEGRYRVWKPST